MLMSREYDRIELPRCIQKAWREAEAGIYVQADNHFQLRGLPMSIDNWTKLLEAIVPLIQSLIWPLLILFILIYLGAPLKKFMGSIGEFTFKAGASGFEATAKKQQIEAAIALGAAEAIKAGTSENMQALDKEKVQDIVEVVSQAITPKAARRLDNAVLLWVDDSPWNNVYERQSLEALGISFDISTSTEDALGKLRLHKYDVVISDMGRPPDSQAGYTLLEGMKKLKINTPFIIYSGSGSRPEYKAEALRRGASGSTDEVDELFQLVVSAIQAG